MKHTFTCAAIVALTGVAFADDQVQQAAQEVAAHYQAGDRAAAQEVDGVQSWDQVSGVTVSCTFKSRPEGALLTVRREAAAGAVAVSFPPGTFGAMNPRSKDRYGELYQDIMFLRAPVVVLQQGQREAQVVVPVACGTYRRHGPEAGVPYELQAVAVGSDIDRLLIQVCAGETAPPECTTALAIWVAREGLGYDYLADRNFHSFATRSPVGVQHGDAARQLLERSGVDVDGLRFYQEAPQSEAAPEADPSPAEEDGSADLS